MSITRETATFDSIDFSQLDEETETDAPVGDVSNNNHNVDMDIIQPHLSLAPPPSTNSRRNPRERGVVIVNEEPDGDRTVHQSVPSSSSGENYNDKPDGDVTVSYSKHNVKENEPTFDDNFNHVASSSSNQNGHCDIITGNGSATGETTASSNNNNNSNSDQTSSTATSNSTNPIQICYSKNTGNISVRESQVAGTREDGTRYIATQQIPQQWDENERKPLRKKRIQWIKAFSIISCILFFPTGIPAVYYAFRIEKEFEEGVLRGNIDRAQKFATRSERLCILSVILCILVAALVVTLIERPKFQSEHYHRGTVAG